MTDIYNGDYEPVSKKYIDWALLSPEERQKKINKSRNYIRYRVARNLNVWDMALVTPEEKLLLELIQDNREAITRAKVAFFSSFYDNCPKVGSTLKRKEKKVKEPLEDLIGKL